jgi:predicted nucleotidyltransferase component of viral defense system
MKGLSLQTEEIFKKISKLECIKDYTLIGGTALALQLGHRLSEDLDFCKWKSTKNEKNDVNWYSIKEELSTIGNVRENILDDNQTNFSVNGVKISFYANNRLKEPPELKKIPFLNNLKIADIKSIGIMKMEVMLRRSSHRDYYDIYSILKNEVSLSDIISGAGKYSEHRLHTKGMLIMLANSERIDVDKHFEQLKPIYNFDLKTLEQKVGIKLKEYIEEKGLQNKPVLAKIISRIKH